jgi:hypothetical protein
VAAGVGEVGHIGVEVLPAAGAVVLGVDQDQLAGSSGEGITQVVKGAVTGAVAVGAMAAAGTGPPIIPAPDADVGLGQVLDAVDALGGEGRYSPGPGMVELLKERSYQELRPPVAIYSQPLPGILAIDSRKIVPSS